MAFLAAVGLGFGFGLGLSGAVVSGLVAIAAGLRWLSK